MTPKLPSLVCLVIAVALVSSGGEAFAPPSGTFTRTKTVYSALYAEPKGCAAKPYEKKKVAVFGAGGYLGAVVFGFLQRAASLYGTGIAAVSSPRAICATGLGAEALNKVLTPKFKLAYAGEDLIRLVDTTNVDHIKERLKGFDAAVLGTTYQVERRPVTLNTYEKSPKDKTYEIYLDEKYGARTDDIPSNDSDVHTSIFRNSVQACMGAGLSHLVVFETVRTESPMDFVKILEEEGAAYTYIRTGSALTKDINYTFEKGVSNVLAVNSVPAGSDLISHDAPATGDESAISREDMAALIVQSLMSLDWKESRVLEVSPTPGATLSSGYGGTYKNMRGLKFDKQWCPNSDALADVLSEI